ncbi:hypothetical protein ACTMU2_35640 (plasmid) [Cupriavidus basilensis]
MDFVDRIPASDKELDEYIKASQHYNLPVLTGSWTYTLGVDEDKIKANIERTREVDAKFHNLMVWAKHADGHYVTDEEVAVSYLNTYEYAEARGITVAYESHVDMWSGGLPPCLEGCRPGGEARRSLQLLHGLQPLHLQDRKRS